MKITTKKWTITKCCSDCKHLKDIDFDTGRECVCIKHHCPVDEPFSDTCDDYKEKK